MRPGCLRLAALMLGILGVPSVAWQVYRAWPLDRFGLYLYATQATVLFVFLSFGLGVGPMDPGYPAWDKETETSTGPDDN